LQRGPLKLAHCASDGEWTISCLFGNLDPSITDGLLGVLDLIITVVLSPSLALRASVRVPLVVWAISQATLTLRGDLGYKFALA
jgi:hypothetical protein